MTRVDAIDTEYRSLMPTDFHFDPVVSVPKRIVDTIVHRDAELAPLSIQETNARKSSVGWSDWLMPWNWFSETERPINILGDDLIGKERLTAQDLEKLLSHWEEVAAQTNDDFKKDVASIYRMMVEVMRRQRELEESGVAIDMGTAKDLTDRKRRFDKAWSALRTKYEEKLEARAWMDFMQRGLEIAGLLGTTTVAVAKGAVNSLTIPGLLITGAVLIDDLLDGKAQKEVGTLLARAIGYVTGRPTTDAEKRYWNSWVRMITHFVGPAVNIGGSMAQQAAQVPQAALDTVQRYTTTAFELTKAGATAQSARVDYLTNHAQADKEVSEGKLQRVSEETQRLLSNVSAKSERSNQIMRSIIEMKRLEREMSRQFMPSR